MNGQQQFLHLIVELLQQSGIEYMLSGSIASGLHGVPRATNDIDLVIDPTPAQLERFVASIPDEMYVSDVAARDALQRRSMFNVIDIDSGWKADLIIRRDRPFSVQEFDRRVTTSVAGHPLAVVTPEDSILSKLEWAKQSGSDRQLQDAVGVARVRLKNLDQTYLERWADELEVVDLLQRVLAEASKTAP